MARTFARIVFLIFIAGLLSGWVQKSAAPAPAKHNYLPPRFPSYLRPPKTVDDVMPYARRLVRNASQRGGKGFGSAQPGQTILVVHHLDADPMILEGIRRALAERNVKLQLVPDYEMVGVSKEDAAAV